MASYNSSEPRPLAHIPPIPIFDPLDFDRSLPASQYTLIKTIDLKVMYQEISRVQAYLHNLINHGDTAQSLVMDDSTQAKPAAIECIPPEILSVIFEQLVPPQSDNDPIETPRMTEFLLPGQICRSWREVAIATPSLWSSLHFDLNRRNVEGMVDMATTCLARAKSNPLYITIRTWDTELTQYRPIIALLLAHSHQWCNLSLDPRASFLARKELKAARDRLLMLRRLEIDYTLVGGSYSDTFQAAPGLRIVDLCNALDSDPWHESVIGHFPLLPWRQLEQITFRGDVGDSLEILRLSPNLLVFKTTTKYSASYVGWNPVHHTYLRELDIDAGGRDSSDLFGALTLPALVSLSYSGMVFPRDGITSFVNRSEISQSLGAFSLTLQTIYEGVAPSMASSDIGEVLECMPNLSQLSLHDKNKHRYTDEGQFHTGDITSICECLSQGRAVLKLKGFAIIGPPRMSCVMLADMVSRRWRDNEMGNGIGRLESVEVNYPGPCVHAKSSLTRIPARNRSIACARALALLRQYQTEGLRVVGQPIDEVECIECIEQQRHRRESGFDSD